MIYYVNVYYPATHMIYHVINTRSIRKAISEARRISHGGGEAKIIKTALPNAKFGDTIALYRNGRRIKAA